MRERWFVLTMMLLLLLMMMMLVIVLNRRETEARTGDGEYGRLSEEAERRESGDNHCHSLLSHTAWQMGEGGKVWLHVLPLE